MAFRVLRETRGGRTKGLAQVGTTVPGLGGALAANVHGRGLRSAPIVADVEAITLVGPGGEERRCSRQENVDLFRSAIGGYGLFGVVATVTLRLARRCKLVRRVRELEAGGAIEALEDAAAEAREEALEALLGDDSLAQVLLPEPGASQEEGLLVLDRAEAQRPLYQS